MGFDKNLYFAASHNDCNHFHVHIAASRINIDGECVSDWYDKRRLEKVLRKLESQFDLTSVPNSWEIERTAPSTGQKRRMLRENREWELGLRDKPADKSVLEKIQDAIETAIKPEMKLTEFIEKLEVNGVEISLRLSDEGSLEGISYSLDGIAFAGHKLGRNAKACTLKGLATRGIKVDTGLDSSKNQNPDDEFETIPEIKTNSPSPIKSKKSQIELD